MKLSDLNEGRGGRGDYDDSQAIKPDDHTAYIKQNNPMEMNDNERMRFYYRALSQVQRGIPENAMLNLHDALKTSNLFASIAEDCGDIVHRAYSPNGYSESLGKARQALDRLTRKYGYGDTTFEQQFNIEFEWEAKEENEDRSAKQIKDDFGREAYNWGATFSKIPRFNQLQQLMLFIPKALGEFDFEQCKRLLKSYLSLSEKEWQKQAAECDPKMASDIRTSYAFR